MTTADKPGPFDKAVDILQWAMNHETATHEQIESIKAVLAVLEAAGKVDVKAGIKEMGDLIIAAQKAARSSEASHD